MKIAHCFQLLCVSAVILFFTPAANCGDIYTSEWDGYHIGIFKYDASGNRSTFVSQISSDFGTLECDKNGTLFAWDTHDNQIKKIDLLGQSSIFASLPSQNASVDDMSFDQNSNLYTANYDFATSTSSILKYNSAGVGAVFVNATPGTRIYSIAFDSSGNLFAATASGEWGSMQFSITKYNSLGEGTLLESSTTFSPSALAFAQDGTLFAGGLALSGGYTDHGEIMEFDSSGGMAIFSSDINVNSPSKVLVYTSLAFDSTGTLYASDTNTRLYKFDSLGNRTTFIDSDSYNGEFTVIPEPSSILLLGMSVGVIGIWKFLF